VFPYSRRTGTPAARMDDQIDKAVKEERVHRLIELSNELAKQYASHYENEVLEVIPEEKVHDEEHPDLLLGYTDNYMKVQFKGTPDLIGQIVRVKITKPGYPINEGVFVKVMEDATHANIKIKATANE